VEELSIRRSVWRSSLITLVVLAVYVGISAVIPQPGAPTGLLLLSLFLALIPSLVWMVFFYQQDRDEPEPKQLVVRMFLFGSLAAVLAVVLGRVFVTQTIRLFQGIILSGILTLLSVSLMQETLKVMMVRYVVLGTNEFDRHPDGIVYGMASGLGFSTVLTIAFVLQSGGVVPLAGAIRAVNNALIHGALGAVSGYYIGRVKIDGKKLPWLFEGLGLVTLVNAIYQVASSEFTSRLVFNPWYGLGVAVVLSIVVVLVLFYFFRRALMRAVGDLTTISIQAHARSMKMPWDIKTRYDYVLLGALLLSLVVGLGVGAIADARMVPYQGDALALTFDYPARWAVEGGQTGGFAARDLSSAGIFNTQISITDEKVRDNSALDLLVADRITQRIVPGGLFSEIDRQPSVEVAGYPAIRSEYQYADQTTAGFAVVHGVDTYVLVESRLYVFTYQAASSDFDLHVGRYDRLLRSVSFKGGQ
jgi:RsiW-degrading membrane proteinase PrsW (M82 family)